MTREEIKKALIDCREYSHSEQSACASCPFGRINIDCFEPMRNYAIKLITEQEAEIEQLKTCNDKLSQGIYFGNSEHLIDKIKQAKIDVLERVKHESCGVYPEYIPEIIDELIEEVKAE